LRNKSSFPSVRSLLNWNSKQAPEELLPGLKLVSIEYPSLVQDGSDGLMVSFEQDSASRGPTVELGTDRAVVRYGTVTHALRGLGTVLTGLAQPGVPLQECLPFSHLGVMIDCSRNAVMTPDHLKRWMTRLAMLGYNGVMLYTEETYTLPGEPYFGYLRGRYTEEDFRGLDQHAADLGIELIPCIQTLGHLENLLKWSAYLDIKDTPSVLMVDSERTYELIDSMLALFARTHRSRRIHLGMDETHDLGRGRFMDQHGYERMYDIFQRHLGRLVDLCGKHGLRPMIWSDMYFRMGNPDQSYYDPATHIPEDVKASISQQIELVYWDYYQEDQAIYEDWIQRHYDLDRPTLMASGIWTWGGLLWHWHEKTLKTIVPCIDACRSKGVKELVFTLWGDDGAFCEFDSAFSGLAYAAEYAIHGQAGIDTKHLARRFEGLIGTDYEAVCTAAEIQTDFSPAMLFWDDPLLGIYWKNEALKNPGHWPMAQRQYGRLIRLLERLEDTTTPIDFAHWHTVTSYLRKVMRFKLALDQAYGARDFEKLGRLEKQASKMSPELEKCNQSFRRQWYSRNRPNGFETIQNRIGARKQRWLELAQRLHELREGRITNIPELEEIPPVPVRIPPQWSSVAASGAAFKD